MKERPILFSGPMVRALLAGTKTQTRRAWPVQPPPGVPIGWTPETSAGRYGKIGDRLWVRETWAPEQYNADATSVAEVESSVRKPAYRADFEGQPAYKWKPSIHMPRAASRTLLEVTEVRVERLQSISEADALAEGIQAMRCRGCHLAAYGLPGWGHDELNPTAQGAYRFLWESINGAGSWALDPLVWAVSFKRITPP